MTPKILEILSTIDNNKVELGITLYDKATDEEIANFEESKMNLPDDFKTFYKFCNGFYSEEDMFRIIPLSEILSNGRDSYLENENSFHFAEYMIYCDMWTISVDPNNKEKYSIYNKTEDVVTLTSSFAEFLDKFLTGGVFEGLYDWRTQFESKK